MGLDGHWRNERGSQMRLRAAADGSVAGTYLSALGRAAGAGGFPIAGRAEGEAVAFTVAWSGRGSVTAWAGRYDPASDTILTQWHLVRLHADPAGEQPTEPWESFLVGQSVWHRVR